MLLIKKYLLRLSHRMLEIKSEKAKGNMISVFLAILKIQVRIGRTQKSSGSFTGEKKIQEC